MNRRVPIARRELFQDRRRVVLSVSGVGAALLLVLVLQGIFAGAMAQVTRYLDRLPADAIVSQRGVKTMHMSSSALPLGTVDAVRAVDGVSWAEPIRFVTGVVTTVDGARQLAYIIGFDPVANRVGPNPLVSGSLPSRGEGVLDRVAAKQLGVEIGDVLQVFGVPVTVSGLSAGGTSITNSTLFVRLDDMAALQPDSISYVMVRATEDVSPAELRDRIASILPDETVQTRAEFARSESRIVENMSADVMRIMSIVSLAIALAVIALALLTLTLARARDYGVIKAIGAQPIRLIGVIAAQAAWIVAAAIAVATAAAFALGVVVHRLQPSIEIVLAPAEVIRTGVAAAAVGMIGALVPLRRMVRLDPASAFRRRA